MADNRTSAVLAFGSFGATPVWVQLLPLPTGHRAWGCNDFKNNTDVRISLRWATALPADADPAQAHCDAGDALTLDHHGQIAGHVYVKGTTADPASGDVVAGGAA